MMGHTEGFFSRPVLSPSPLKSNGPLNLRPVRRQGK